MSSDPGKTEDSPAEGEQDRAGLRGSVSAAAASRALAERLARGEPIGTSEAPPGADTVDPPPFTETEPAKGVREQLASGPPPAPADVTQPVAAAATKHSLAPPRRRRLWIALALGASLLLIATLAGSGYLALSNKSRADRWEGRALTLERNVDQLNGLLVARSNTLNARTRELNRMAGKVRQQQSSLRRSEADVSSLEQRQRALAAEKAEVEDSRAQLAVQAASLENVADAFVDCKDGLVELLGYILDEDYYSTNVVISRVSSDCGYAESALSDYNATYP